MKIVFEYRDADEGVCITKYRGEASVLRIPDMIEDQPVGELDEYVFYESSAGLEKIIVPDTVKRNRPYAFAMCSELKEIVLGDGVEILGEEFSQATAVKKIFIPASVRTIEAPEEMECAIEADPESPYFMTDGFGLYRRTDQGLYLLSVSAETEKEGYMAAEGTVSIREKALRGNGYLRRLILPDSIREIPEGALSGSKRSGGSGEGIEDIRITGSGGPFYISDGCLYRAAGGDGAELVYCFRKRKEITLPEDVRVIDSFAFVNCGAESLTISSDDIDIHKDAFRGCPLQEVILAGPERREHGGTRITFPTSVAHLREDLMEGFGSGSGIYDFAEYDRTLINAYLSRERIDMMLNRLENPEALTEESRTGILSRIKNEWEKVLEIIVKEDDRQAVESICRQELLGAEDLDEWIRFLSEFGEGFGTSAREKMVTLTAYKNERFRNVRHDYSL